MSLWTRAGCWAAMMRAWRRVSRCAPLPQAAAVMLGKVLMGKGPLWCCLLQPGPVYEKPEGFMVPRPANDVSN